MPTEAQPSPAAYFETPERSERLQLIIHLLHNAEEVPYLRGPSGAGKTRFAAHLVDKTSDDFSVAWVNAGHVDELRKTIAAEFGLDAQMLAWPGELVEAAGDKLLLVIVDDADHLELPQIAELFELHEAGGRLLFLGAGGLSNVQGDWDLQFVDLPPFSEEQSIAFLNSRQQTDSAGLGENVARSLHRAAGGLPGPLLNALSAQPQAVPEKPVGNTAARRSGLSGSMVLLAGGGVLALVLAMVFQDDINSLFEPPADSPEPTAGVVMEQPVEPVKPTTAEFPEQPAEPVGLVEKIDREVQAKVVESPPETDLPEGADAAPPEAAIASEPPPSIDSAQGTDSPEPAQEPDPVLDAVIEAAIAAAAQPPEPELEPPPQAEVGQAEEKQPTPVPEVQAPEAATTAAPQPQEVKPPQRVPSRTVAPESAAPDGYEAWLMAQAPGDYTLQLVGARDTDAIQKFIARHNVKSPYAVFQRDLNGEPWYSLVAGVYPDRDAAVAARSRLAPPLNGSGVWPRTFASILEQLQNKP